MKINQVEIFISNYQETVSFYKDILEFVCIFETADMTSFQVSSSILTLHKDETHSYYYHFAFNIPPNLFKSAKNWIQERWPLLTEDDSDEIHLTGSKANSFYFEDPAGNIVEYIARYETITESLEECFQSNLVLGISEIGLSTSDIKKYVEEILALGIPTRNDEPISYEKYLNFMGEFEDGEFIIVGPEGRRWIFSDKVGIPSPVIIKTNHGTIKNF
ncbi:VOC family protein [Bacillus sp. S/N-304-OC-R1]|uniref:VOC family protein n=1 Tax=Bacillus sp. S/N-304-OC-R1 TaxID=2758034 RepID=UPI001C8D71D1|nr:VOC family protein [Bacillus sp. S/N-304-OC-R1]MBY0124355.1 hypothetical protein [Bacillus sp. S/N-304-OC-R1]